MSPLAKTSTPPTPWLCLKCGAIVYVIPDHHAYLCGEYRKRREKLSKSASKILKLAEAANCLKRRMAI
jgi:hypothetical protein